MRDRTCCFLGHRKINATKQLFERIEKIVEELIVKENIDTFLFGSKSEFNDICYEIVTLLKDKYPHIKRIYVRAEYPYIDEKYKEYLMEIYDETYYPKTAVAAGKATYIKRNFEMIDKSSFCVIYFDISYVPLKRKSGTSLGYEYAKRKGIKIINVC